MRDDIDISFGRRNDFDLFDLLFMRTVQSVRNTQQRTQFLDHDLRIGRQRVIKEMRHHRRAFAVIPRNRSDHVHFIFGQAEKVSELIMYSLCLPMMCAVIDEHANVMEVRG